MNERISMENKFEKEQLPNNTLLFLVKKSQGEITDVCLAIKKRGFGINMWNGVGGKVEEERETIEEAVGRETKEEIDVDISTEDLKKVALISFYFPHNPEWDRLVHVYITEKWEGNPKESEEMSPKWFSTKDIPYNDMWPADRDWLKKVIEGNYVKGKVKFGEKTEILEKKICIVEKLETDL